MLYPSDIVNNAPSRTIQARNHIVRVPAIVRVKSLGTYPYYRGHPTVSYCYNIQTVNRQRTSTPAKGQLTVST